jgi:glycosyltransferase involved in cell wall biosynthesis
VEQLPQSALTDDAARKFEQLPPPPAGPFRAVCIGRLLHWKGFHLAIRAFDRYARRDPEAELWLLGDGPFRPELEKVAAQAGARARIKFLGNLAYPQVLARLGQAHVLIHPSLHEGFGNVCSEAMAAGRPVVCLDLGGPAAQVNNEVGFVAPATTPAETVSAMASFVERIAGDRALLAAMSLKAKARVREKFTMRALGAAITGLYREALAAPKPARH